METVSGLVNARGEELLSLLESLLMDHSSVYLWNRPDSSIFFSSGNHAFRELDANGRQLQSRLLEEYRQFADLLNVLLREQPEGVRKDNHNRRQRVLDAIEQQGPTWYKSVDEVWASAQKALQAQLESIQNLYGGSSEGLTIVVPDTNALLFNPALEEWNIGVEDVFEISLVPSVTSELDSLKMSHRNMEVREKAESLIRRIKGYRQRGRLVEGVVLRQGISHLRAAAVEPDFSVSLPWLDPTNMDDRLIASFLEVMRQNPRSAVVLATRDLNLQNKLEFARLPFIEPPTASSVTDAT